MTQILRLLALLLLISSTAFSQTAVMSNDYWLSYLPSIENTAPIWALVSTNTEGTTVKVEYSDDGSHDEFSVGPNKPKEYRVKIDPFSADKHQMAKPSEPDVIQRRSMHITSNHPISVQQFTDADNNVSMSLPIPTGYLGRKYVIAAFNDQHSRLSESGGSTGGWEPAAFPPTSGEYIIIAAEDSTVVTITAAGKHSNGLLPGQSMEIKLRKGETYWGKGLADTSTNDISGTTIRSTRPIAVTAGCEVARTYDAMVLQNHFDFNDYIAEYMIPVEQWGTEYVGGMLTNKRGSKEDDLWGDLYRIYAAEETELFMNGQSRGVGKYWEFSLQTVPRTFTAEKPIMVTQYDYYIDFHGLNPKSPRTSNSMSLLLPRHQWSKEVTCTIPTGYAQTFFYVTAHRDSIDKITVLLPGKSQPIPLGGLKYSGAQTQNIGEYRIYTLVLGAKGQVRFTGPCQFQVLNHGTRDNDQIKATYGYASVVGSTFGRSSNSDFLVKIDSACGKFDVMLQDTAEGGDGFADIQLLAPGSYPSYASTNVALKVSEHAIGSREVRATVSFRSPLNDAFAALLVRTRAGKEKIVTMRYRGPRISSTPSVSFSHVRYGDTASSTMAIVNNDSLPVTITGLQLLRGDTAFSVTSIDALPHTLAPGADHPFTVSYSPVDTGFQWWDSIVVTTDCFSAQISKVQGSGSVATIFADDRNYGPVDLGSSRTESIEIKNLNVNTELTITGFDLANSAFRIDSSESGKFPILLARAGQVGDRVALNFSYEPENVGRDTGFVYWHTDILAPYDENNRKPWSILTGEAHEPLAVRSQEIDPALIVTNNRLHLSLAEGEVIRSIQLTDLLGRILSIKAAAVVDLSEIASGVYFLNVVTNKRSISQKIIR